MSGSVTPVARVLFVVGALLMALAEVRRLVSSERLAWIVPFDAFVTGSSVGLSVVLTTTGFVVARALIRARERGIVAAVATGAWIVVPLWVLQAVVAGGTWLAVRLTDPEDVGTRLTSDVWLPLLTFQWNLWVADHVLFVPPELGGLFVFSILAQLIGGLTLLVLVLPTFVRAWALGIAAVAGALVVSVLRVQALDFQDPFVLAVDTMSRSDAFLWGVAAACAVRLWRGAAPPLADAALPALLAPVLATVFATDEQHYMVQLPATALLAAVSLLQTEDPAGDRVLSHVGRSDVVRVLWPLWPVVVAVATPVAVLMSRVDGASWMQPVLAVIAVAFLVRGVAFVVDATRRWWERRSLSSGEVSDEDRRARSESSAQP